MTPNTKRLEVWLKERLCILQHGGYLVINNKPIGVPECSDREVREASKEIADLIDWDDDDVD